MRLKTATWLTFVLVFSFVEPARAQEGLEISGNLTQVASGLLQSSGGQSGFGNFSMPNLLGGLIFSSVGFVAFMYGKKNAFFKPMVIGLVLMAYSWIVTETWLVYAVGIGLTASLYFLRD